MISPATINVLVRFIFCILQGKRDHYSFHPQIRDPIVSAADLLSRCPIISEASMLVRQPYSLQEKVLPLAGVHRRFARDDALNAGPGAFAILMCWETKLGYGSWLMCLTAV